jgi:hypothetical protein
LLHHPGADKPDQQPQDGEHDEELKQGKATLPALLDPVRRAR